VLAAQGDHGGTRQALDDDLADPRHADLEVGGTIAIPRFLEVNRGFRSVYPKRGAGTAAEVMGTTKEAESAGIRLRLRCEPASVAQGRARVRAWCKELGIADETIADVQLAVTEASANAVRHSGCAEFEIRGWTCEASAVVRVWDQGRGRDDPIPGAGLGIAIIRALTQSVEFKATEPGTRVTMRFQRTDPRDRE